MNSVKGYFRSFLFVVLTVSVDALFVFTADIVSFFVRFGNNIPRYSLDGFLRIAPLVVILRLFAFYIFNLYGRARYKSDFEIIINSIKATSLSTVLIVFILYFRKLQGIPPSIVFLSWFFTLSFISFWRFLEKGFAELFFGKDYNRMNLLVIGTGKHAREVAMHATKNAAIDYNFLGFVDTEDKKQSVNEHSEILGGMNDMEGIIKKYRVDEVVIAQPDIEKKRIAQLIKILDRKKISLRSVPATYDNIIENMVLYEHGIPFLGPTVISKPAFWYWSVKTILDMVFSLIILLVTLPFLALAVILIKITSPGPVVYLQKRTGKNGVPFIMYKLRTMHAASEKGRRPRWAKTDDVRITRVGKILRRFRIDELPQILNVLKGEMSLVGPRPERPYFTTRLLKKIPFYAERLQVKPGITGWAQVNFGYTATEAETEKKLLYDIFYIQNMSFVLDLLIMLKTIKIVITGSGAR